VAAESPQQSVMKMKSGSASRMNSSDSCGYPKACPSASAGSAMFSNPNSEYRYPMNVDEVTV
jgi:hypothetical protein